MKFAENSTQSAEYLRQAIPLMVKYNIPPNPLNYALWYTYVSNKIPSLNFQLDRTLDTYGTCPSLLSEQLFRDHVINEEIADSDEAKKQLMVLSSTLFDNADYAAKHTSEFGVVLEDTLEALSNPSDALPIESIINRLAENTASISSITAKFQQQIAEAQAEITALKAELQKTRQDARIDPLTGLFNRRVFETELLQILGTSTSHKSSLVILDIDHFKKFNDDYGHLMGDKVLQYFGKLLKEECKEPALPIRYGGEEFAILLIGQSSNEALELSESIRHKIQAIKIKQKKSGKVISAISASFGISQIIDGDTAESIIERADKALYESKSAGRNRATVL